MGLLSKRPAFAPTIQGAFEEAFTMVYGDDAMSAGFNMALVGHLVRQIYGDVQHLDPGRDVADYSSRMTDVVLSNANPILDLLGRAESATSGNCRRSWFATS